MSRAGRAAYLMLLLGILMALFPAGPAVHPAYGAPTSPVSQNNWVVNWNITLDDGIGIFNVTYKGVLVLRDARVPGIIVEYPNNPCYFYDELRSAWIGPPNPPPSGLYVENVTGGGFQIRGNYDVPGYDYEQIWRFFPDGHFMGLMQVGGGGCYAVHIYQPHWRYSFAIGEDNRNSFSQYTSNGWIPVRQESELVDTGPRDPSNSFTTWKVAQGKRAYYFAPYDSPDAPYSPGTALFVQDHPGEIENSHFPGVVNPEVYMNDESVWRNNIALFYTSKHLHNPLLEIVFGTPILTGLIFYPSGY